MRSSLVIASALAIGALAGPIEKRKLVTEVATKVETITVFVTAAPTPRSSGQRHRGGKNTRSWGNRSGSKSAPAPAPTSVTAPKETPKSDASPGVTSWELSASNAPAPGPTFTSARTVPKPAPSSGSHPTGAIQATLQSGADYQAAILYHHNAARANHGASPLVWAKACEDGARRTADLCTFSHPDFLGELKQGQNLFATSGDAFNATAGITESWYKGELTPMMPYFGQKDIPDEVVHSVGHLTQMLWKGTSKVGCVSVDCGEDMKLGDGTPTDMNKYTICNYAAPGNYAGKYAENVQAPINANNLGSWSD